MTDQGTLRWHHNECDDVSSNRRLDCLLNHLFRCRSMKIIKHHVSGLCQGNPPVTGEFPSQRASNAKNYSIWWRHHEINCIQCMCIFRGFSRLVVASHRCLSDVEPRVFAIWIRATDISEWMSCPKWRRIYMSYMIYCIADLEIYITYGVSTGKCHVEPQSLTYRYDPPSCFSGYVYHKLMIFGPSSFNISYNVKGNLYLKRPVSKPGIPQCLHVIWYFQTQ